METCWNFHDFPYTTTSGALPGKMPFAYTGGIQPEAENVGKHPNYKAIPALRYCPRLGDASVRRGWFWNPNQSSGPEWWKQIYFNCIGRGSSMMYGFAPDRHGHFPEEDVAGAVALRKMLNEIQQTDFDAGKPITADTTWKSIAGHEAAKAVDGDARSHMTTSLRFPVHRLILCGLAFACLSRASTLSFTADLLSAPDGGVLMAGDKPAGFKVAPVIVEEGGTRLMTGPGVWETDATDGIVSLKFTMLGFDSAHQHELMSIHSDAGKPYGVIRNVNSSGRLEGANVISGAKNRYTPGGWHAVEIMIDTRKGLLSVRTDGKPRCERNTGIENARFTGISFANTMKLRDFSVGITPLPALSLEEITLMEATPVLEKQIQSLPEISPDQTRKKTTLLYQLEKLRKSVEQNAFDIGVDIMANIRDGLTRDIGRKSPDHPWLQPVM